MAALRAGERDLGLSPDESELAARDVTTDHIDYAFVEITRHLLAAGATIAYGGDFRAKGYTHRLTALLNRFRGECSPARADRISRP